MCYALLNRIYMFLFTQTPYKNVPYIESIEVIEERIGYYKGRLDQLPPITLNSTYHENVERGNYRRNLAMTKQQRYHYHLAQHQARNGVRSPLTDTYVK